ncbi:MULTISPECIES: ATP-binding cassette domain-containing protein [unclassified Streptomyces]|uniref:ATP-binding cassette domain-containing protein n=1 Tax=unclassified Streptomyces TaxID=2593676 RepID=UPI00224E406E|nr:MULTISPECIES: ATP-binding cassette domain-containing protein [unclassified Streptomyces]WSP54134.1 ATP-binding cassette domain-containing protein [Streptomyces sp. NBC_01241]WSU25191.1 ATP-binding cassette domain-containing protein [Streptomyces sp. NBC_01108]MCX4785639.1 ATP-binding cassette domain-containing protein [Streptomyces sp. NBC_01221]MCX4798502.1 ATP-binding cassette domain-containing protein [Streptomyces sp. NBC_01242]WSJ39725.1 ATP-binding cassette domain-containing protein [
MSTRAPAVAARQLIKTYPGDVTALRGMDLDVDAGTVFGLLGPNGAGKSTTVKILTTLARPDSGTASVAGHDVLRHPDRVRRAIGVVAQKSGADPVATGRENLLLQGRLYGMRGAAVQRRVDELLDRFDLADAGKRQVKGYSGGMQRRLDVALGLVHRPEVLFLDEPTTGLDPEARTAMWDEISRLAGDEGLTIVLTTHYLEEADRLAERIAIVDRGRIVVEGAPDDLKGELRGDAVHMELRADGDTRAVDAALTGLPGVHEVLLDGRRVSVRAEDGAAAVPVLLAALERAGAAVAAATVARPSLDDVYLRYAGRRFSEADAADARQVPAPTPVGGAR